MISNVIRFEDYICGAQWGVTINEMTWGIIYQKMIHPHLVPNPYVVIFSIEHKWRNYDNMHWIHVFTLKWKFIPACTFKLKIIPIHTDLQRRLKPTWSHGILLAFTWVHLLARHEIRTNNCISLQFPKETNTRGSKTLTPFTPFLTNVQGFDY